MLCRTGIKAMADLKYSVILDDEEIVALIQLLNAHLAQLAEQSPNVVAPFESTLKRKLLEIRTAGMVAARAAGTLK
jgi:hypothetical protein